MARPELYIERRQTAFRIDPLNEPGDTIINGVPGFTIEVYAVQYGWEDDALGQWAQLVIPGFPNPTPVAVLGVEGPPGAGAEPLFRFAPGDDVAVANQAASFMDLNLTYAFVPEAT